MNTLKLMCSIKSHHIKFLHNLSCPSLENYRDFIYSLTKKMENGSHDCITWPHISSIKRRRPIEFDLRNRCVTSYLNTFLRAKFTM